MIRSRYTFSLETETSRLLPTIFGRYIYFSSMDHIIEIRKKVQIYELYNFSDPLANFINIPKFLMKFSFTDTNRNDWNAGSSRRIYLSKQSLLEKDKNRFIALMQNNSLPYNKI